MAIVGTGIDICEVARVAASIERFGERFLGRVYTPNEIAYCRSRKRSANQSFAARFAAKEAAMKALGTGWGKGVRWRDIEVARQPGGRPTIIFHGVAQERAERLGGRQISLSITHTGNFALAEVILEN